MLQHSLLQAQTSSLLQQDVMLNKEEQISQKVENVSNAPTVSQITIPTKNARLVRCANRPLPFSEAAPLHDEHGELHAGCTRQLHKPRDESLTAEQLEIRERALKRRNDSAAALGNLRRFQCGKLKLYFGPKYYVYFIVSAITLGVIVANMAMVWNEVGSCEFAVTIVVLCITFASSWLVMSTDPGVYPRLRSNEVDCLGENHELRYCRVCKLNRPPRTSHCYQCNVCIFDHDHHCDILGACVGARNLRWFTLYLFSCSTSTFIGVWWLSRSLLRNVFNAPTEMMNYSTNQYSVEDSCALDNCDHGARHVFIFLMIIVDALVGFIVGGLGVLYLWLVANSMTRRVWNDAQVMHATLQYLHVVNSNRHNNCNLLNENNEFLQEQQEQQLCRRDVRISWQQGCTRKFWCTANNMWAVAFPPTSMLSSPSITAFCSTPISSRTCVEDNYNYFRSEATDNEVNGENYD